jgi:hypothetical protein
MIKIVLDKRRKLNDDKYSLAVRVCLQGNVQYLPILRLSESQYDQVFAIESIDENSIKYREYANAFKTKCERILSEMGAYNAVRFRVLVRQTDKDVPKTLVICKSRWH